MTQDFARKRKAPAKRKQAPARKKVAAPAPARSGWRWFFAGLLSGLLLSFLLYLSILPPAPGTSDSAIGSQPSAATEEPPRPRFDFYTMLPEQTIEVEQDPAQAARAHTAPAQAQQQDYYLLQAGSFRQQEDADRRRAELLLLGLEPKIEEATGDNGRWFRVHLGPFETRSTMASARSLTAAQDIDTLLLKRKR